MSTRLIFGVVTILCLGAGLAVAETPADAAEGPVEMAEGPCLGPGMVPPEVMRPPHHGAWLGPMHRGRPDADAGRGQLERLSRALELDDEQRAAFVKIREQQRADMDALRLRLREGGRKLREALDAASPAPATVGALMIEQRAAMKKLENARYGARQALRALLTAEQKAVFESLPRTGPRGRMAPPPPRGPEPPEGFWP